VTAVDDPVEITSARLPGPALHDFLRAARQQPGLAPVRLVGRAALLVARFDDVKEFLADAERFPGGPVYGIQVEPVVGRTFISMDGDEHLRTRQLAMPAFRSRVVSRFVDEQLVPLAHEIVDRFATRGEGDLVADLTDVLPFAAISRKVGLPVGTEEGQRIAARRLLSYPATPEVALRAAGEVTDVVRVALEQRRREPADDVLSHLLATGMDDEAVLSHVRLLYAVGATTTADAMSNLFAVLLARPELVERARVEPALRPRIVGELLRYEPPVPLLPRLATRPGTVGGVEVPAGTLLVAGLAAANRDPSVYADPDAFDPDRQEGELLTFGFGPKFCPGWNLARSQLLAALEVVLERLPGLRLAADVQPEGAVLRSTPHLPVRWSTAPGRRSGARAARASSWPGPALPPS
jgi:cytochrome P450